MFLGSPQDGVRLRHNRDRTFVEATTPTVRPIELNNLAPSLAAELDRLRRDFDLAAVEVTIADRAYRLVKPRSADDLLDEEAFARDERIPYWAELWPSALVAARWLAGLSRPPSRVLELGCGLGLPSLVAAARGCRVLATDYYDESLRFVALQAALNGLPPPETRLLDWRRLPDATETFDLILGADVLYERPYPELIARIVSRCLAADGLAWITDPDRLHAARFPESCQRHGLCAVPRGWETAEVGPVRQRVACYEVRRAKG